MPELRLARRASRDLAQLPSWIQEAVLETLGAISRDPSTAGKPLLGRLLGLWSARVGNCRVLYTIEERAGSARVIVRAIRHRAAAYRRRGR